MPVNGDLLRTVLFALVSHATAECNDSDGQCTAKERVLQ